MFLLVFAWRCHSASLPPLVCPAGGPIGSIDLRVQSTGTGTEPLPLRTINRLEEGDTLLYRPLLRSGEERRGEVTLVLVPSNKIATGEKLLILDVKPAKEPQQWTVPWRVSVVAFVYGPSGLSTRKVRSFLARDEDLVTQLADYAEKTAQTEALIAALSSPSSSAPVVQSALRGFSSQYGLNVQIDRNATPNQQALTLFRSLNPAIAAYDPISPQGYQSVSQTAGLAASVATLFFGSPVGLAAGGTAMLLELRSVAFPKTEFRSSFSQSVPGDGLGLCGRRDAAPAHTKIAYLWASRVPNTGPPKLSTDKANSLPAGLKSSLAVSASDTDWKFLDRARNWALQSEDGKTVPIKVQKLGDAKTLELDLEKTQPGKYKLAASWDWDRFQVAGQVEVRPLSDFASARLVSSSQDLLVARTGKVPVTIEGSDFEFVTKVEIQKTGDQFASPEPVRFVLPRGLGHGPQQRLDIQVNTIDLDPGQYTLLISQVDGKSHPVNVKVLYPPPSIDNFPAVLNQGSSTTELRLKGQRLNLLKRLEIAKGKASLAPAYSPSERALTLRMDNDIAAGTSLSVKAYVEDRTEPLTFSDAVRIAGPRPAITEVRVSQPPDQDVQLDSGELPGGVYLSAILRVRHVQSNSIVKLGCQDSDEPVITLRLGERSGPLSLQQLTPDQMFLSFDSSTWATGCLLQAKIANGNDGESDASRLGRIVRVPRIESFGVAGDSAATGQMQATLTGQNLETIERVGWAENAAEPVNTLPLPDAGNGARQVLQVQLPPPPGAETPLIVWLRGESRPRTTRLHLHTAPVEPAGSR